MTIAERKRQQAAREKVMRVWTKILPQYKLSGIKLRILSAQTIYLQANADAVPKCCT